LQPGGGIRLLRKEQESKEEKRPFYLSFPHTGKRRSESSIRAKEGEGATRKKKKKTSKGNYNYSWETYCSRTLSKGGKVRKSKPKLREGYSNLFAG